MKTLTNKPESENKLESDREVKTTLFMVNIILTTRVKKLQSEVDSIKHDIKTFEGSNPNSFSMSTPVEIEKKKRKRKKKNEVDRNYKCNIEGCQKSYGSENSLNQHMKIKHPNFWVRIKEKEQNLMGVNTFKTPEEIFHKHRQSIMNSDAKGKRDYREFSGPEMGYHRGFIGNSSSNGQGQMHSLANKYRRDYQQRVSVVEGSEKGGDDGRIQMNKNLLSSNL